MQSLGLQAMSMAVVAVAVAGGRQMRRPRRNRIEPLAVVPAPGVLRAVTAATYIGCRLRQFNHWNAFGLAGVDRTILNSRSKI